MDNNFRIIIVGGGPIGLLAAHCLSKANIDFVLLEQRTSLTPDSGASIGIYPSTFRIFDQLGLLEPLQEVWGPLRRKLVITHDGHIYKDHPRFDWMKNNHGHPFAMIHRFDLLQCLYMNLQISDRARLQTDKQVVTIETSETGVTVICTDGSIEQGSIVIGADGVHSKVRGCMQGIASNASPPSALNMEKQYTSSFQLMYGAARLLPTIEPETSWEAHGTDMATQLFVGYDKMWFFWYEKLASPTQGRRTYNTGDEIQFVKKWGHVHITDQVQLKDVYAAKLSSGMTLLEEGMVQHWSGGRIVLVGDAAVKTSVHLAFGFNGGVQNLVALMNGLYQMVKGQNDGCPSASDLERVFVHYQAATMPVAEKFVAASGEMTKNCTWSTWKDWLMDRYILGAIDADYKTYHEKIGPLLAQSLVLDFLEEKNLPTGKMAWKHFPKLREDAPCLSAKDVHASKSDQDPETVHNTV